MLKIEVHDLTLWNLPGVEDVSDLSTVHSLFGIYLESKM